MDTGQLISKISIRLRRRSGKTGKRLGITETQGRILEYILLESREHPLFQKDIEAEFGLRPSTATELLKSLEEQKLIRRVSSENDGRYKIIRFTGAAEELRAVLQGELMRTEELLTRGISETELADFMRIADQMLTNLDSEE